jgi:hypothetical protein
MTSNLTLPRVSAIYKSGPTFSSKILQTLLSQGFQPGPLFFYKTGPKVGQMPKNAIFDTFLPSKNDQKIPQK